MAPFGDDQPGENEASGTPPGIVDGRLANATALVQAHDASLDESGFAANVTRSTNGETIGAYEVVVTEGRSHYLLSGTQSTDDSTLEIDLWGNESVHVARYRSNGESRYQASDRGTDPFTPLAVVGRYLRAGNFTVANETADGYTVLTADELAPSATEHGRFRDADSFDARVVVDGTGRVHELTVSIERHRSTETYTVGVDQTSKESIEQPAWVDDVPADAFASPRLTVDVENQTVLSIRNEGGDPVPANATIALTTNDTTYDATFEESLQPGAVRYASISAADGTLQLTSDYPTSDVIALTSPVSVTIETASGATLHSGGIGWGESSESSETSSGEGGSSSSEHGQSATGSDSAGD